MSDLYITQTASLKAQKANLLNLSTKRLKADNIQLGDKNILDYLDEVSVTIKHASDTREVVTENDLWGQWVELKDGASIIHNDFVQKPAGYTGMRYDEVTKEVDNKAYIGDEFYANIQTDMIEDGQHIFAGRPSQLASFSSDLKSLKKGNCLFDGCSLLTSAPETPALQDGFYMFEGTGLGTYSRPLPNLRSAEHMFSDCASLRRFESATPLLEEGSFMFSGCNVLKVLEADFSSLRKCQSMFDSCSELSSFDTSLPSLWYGDSMFTYCTKLASFTSDLNNLTQGSRMFAGCTSLEHFTSSLSSLEFATEMFTECILSPESIEYIADSLPHKDMERNILIGINLVPSDGLSTEEHLQLKNEFAKEAGYDSWDELNQTFTDKKWDVSWQFNKGKTAANLLDAGFGGSSIYAKLIEVADRELAEYCTEDGEKFYNISWCHETNNPEGYDYFGSLLEACGYYGVIPKKYLEEAQ